MASDVTVPLNPIENSAWRALTYIANHLVKVLGEDLATDTRMSQPEYVVLVHLSEADSQQLRIGDLASICALSPSRMSRLIDEMTQSGFVSKSRIPEDGRCMVATLTPIGLKALQATYPIQLRNVRRRVFDLLTEEDVAGLNIALWKIRNDLEARSQKTIFDV